MSKQASREGQLNAVIDPKLLFLGKMAARSKKQTLIEFIEDAFRLALSRKAMDEEEPTDLNRHTREPLPLWNEGLWIDTGKEHEDAAARLFMVGMADANLLAPGQRAVFHHIITDLAKQGKKVTLKNFVEYIDYSESGE